MLTETAVTGEFVVAFQVVPLGTDISVIAFPTINDAEDAIEKLKGVDINGQPVSLSLAPVSLSCPSARRGLIVRMRDLRPLSPDDLLLETLEDLDTTIDEATTTDEVATMTADRGMMIVTTTDREDRRDDRYDDRREGGGRDERERSPPPRPRSDAGEDANGRL
jgi:hypothetical protein